MWLLEHEDDALHGKRLWLRPGKRYLFGRTVAEPGMLAISGEKANSVSRKHVLICVDSVREGGSQDLESRSQITVEDLGSKIGTTINGQKIKGEKHVIKEKANTLKMGNMSGFKITWSPVVLSFAFSKKELLANVAEKLRLSLEQLDIKYLSDYSIPSTTHAVSKNRNTPKALQALVNGRFVVNDRFVDAIINAARVEQLDGAVERSPLEADFDAHWPEAIRFLPEPKNEPVVRPSEAFAPNPARNEIFDGYTFIFYNKAQCNNLVDVITCGKGKALCREVNPRETQIDDFIRYVKSVAGEKGLGEFEDGSEGRGVVVVRFLPGSPTPQEDVIWFEQFYTSVSLRLDHRLIDQKDFLDAILGNDASVLRRPLEVDSQPAVQDGTGAIPTGVMDVDEEPVTVVQSQASIPRRRGRGAAPRRFKGFVADSDDDSDGEAVPDSGSAVLPPTADSPQSQGLFVSQDADTEALDEAETAQRSQRKRPASHISPGHDITDDFAPTAAQLKRRRIADAQDPTLPQRRTSAPEPADGGSDTTNSRTKTTPKVKKEIDVLEIARKNREEAEARARSEREDLAQGVDDLDLAEIRRLQIQEPMELRRQPDAGRTREQDIEQGRWDPKWNGRRNFKKFYQRGAVGAARAPRRIIVSLEEVRSKAFGIGDDYWLEDSTAQKKDDRRSQDTSQSTSLRTGSGDTRKQTQEASKIQEAGDGNDPEDDELDPDGHTGEDFPSLSSKRAVGAASTAQGTQRSQQARTQDNTFATLATTQKSQPSSRASGRKRAAAAPPARETPAKRSKVNSVADSDDDDSEDDMRFRFRRR